MKVPADLQPVAGFREIRYSLHTRSPSEADRLAQVMAEGAILFFKKLRRQERRAMKFTSAEIKRILREYLRRALDEDERDRQQTRKPWTEQELDDHLENLSTLKSDYLEALALNDYHRARYNVDECLEQHGLKLDQDAAEYKEISREMLKTIVNILEVDLRRSVGDYSMQALPYPDLVPSPQPSSQLTLGNDSSQDQGADGAAPGETFSQVVERLAQEKKATGAWTAKTEENYRSAFDLFIEVVGDLPVNRIDRRMIDSFKQTLLRLPANMRKIPRYKDKTIPQILAMKNVEPMAAYTVNVKLNRLSVLFNYAEIHGLIQKNPASGMLLKKHKRDDQLREVFTPDDLRKLFHSRLYLDDAHEYSYTFWVPIIALYSGMRLEEICQAHLDDVRQEDGVWVWDVNARTPDKRVKNPGSARLVPLHPFLLDALKLPRYAERLREKGEDRFFPELERLRDGYGQRVSKWFARHRKECGVTEEGHVFHSFRHTFIDALKQSREVEPHLISEIVGHSVESITMSRYGKRYAPEKLFDAIKRVRYDVDLSHLARSRFVRG